MRGDVRGFLTHGPVGRREYREAAQIDSLHLMAPTLHTEIDMRLIDFLRVYRLYRSQHPARYAARIAFGIAFRGMPF
jgi:hypothetical protein